MNVSLALRASPEFIKAIDDWRRVQEDLPSRGEAIRRLVQAALNQQKKAKGR